MFGSRFYRNIQAEYAARPQACCGDLLESLGFEQNDDSSRSGWRRKNAEISIAEFSFRDLAEQFLGREWVQGCHPDARTQLLEADGVDTTAFANITGQLLISAVLEGYLQEAFVATSLVRTIPTRLDGERIPGTQRLKDDEIRVIEPGLPFTNLGFGERYIDTPSTDKRGLICGLTREAIFFDRTNQVLDRAFEVGQTLGTSKEKRILDEIIGVTNSYNENGSAIDTYQTATPWINEISGNALLDWQNIDASSVVFADADDPDTGNPIIINANQLLVTPFKKSLGAMILGAMQINLGDTTTASPSGQTATLNPVGGNQFQLSVSALMQARIVDSGETAANGKDWWFHGDFRRAFAYMENWPIEVVQAPLNSHDSFHQDIVTQVRASERGTAAVLDPRYVNKNYLA